LCPLEAEGRLVAEPESNQCDQGQDPVLGSDLFAFGIGAAVVGDRHFEYFVSALEELGRDFGFDIERRRPQPKIAQYGGPHGFVTGLHVGEHRVVQNVRNQGEKPVGRIVPKQKDAMGAHEAAAIHGVRAHFDDGFDQ